MASLLRWVLALAGLLALGTWLPRPTPRAAPDPIAQVPHGLSGPALYNDYTSDTSL